MESAADQPPPAPKLSRATGHVVVSREHLSGRLPAGISVAASDTVGSHRRSPLRTGRDHRRAQQRVERRRPRFQQPMLTIHDRRFPPEDRSEPGHWERDLIIGKDQARRSAHSSKQTDQTRRLLHLPNRDGEALHDAQKAKMTDLP